MLQMIFLFVVICITPPLISVVLYERLSAKKLTAGNRIVLYIIFAFFTTLAGIAAIWAFGWGYRLWIPDADGVMTGLTYVLFYAAVSLAAAVILPHAVCLLRASAAAEEEEINARESSK